MRYDTIILGGNRAAQQAALVAAQAGQRVVMIATSDEAWDGALATELAATPSIVEALADLVDGDAADLATADTLSQNTLRDALVQLVRDDAEITAQQLEWNGVDVLAGHPEFVDDQTVVVTTTCISLQVSADRMIVATGTRSERPARLPFDGQRLLTIEDLLQLESLPEEMLIVGGGQTGLLAAVALAQFGTAVTVIDNGETPPGPTYDDEQILLGRATALGVQFRSGLEVIGVEPQGHHGVVVRLSTGRPMLAMHVLWCAGSVGRTDDLNLAAAGLEADEHGRLWCDAEFQTWNPRIMAAGDVVGWAGLREKPAARRQDVAHVSLRTPRSVSPRGSLIAR